MCIEKLFGSSYGKGSLIEGMTLPSFIPAVATATLQHKKGNNIMSPTISSRDLVWTCNGLFPIPTLPRFVQLPHSLVALATAIGSYLGVVACKNICLVRCPILLFLRTVL